MGVYVRPETVMVDILMATYNGEKLLPFQLASISRQTHKNWRIIVRDDGSSDNTVQILCDFAALNPGKVIIIDDKIGNLGALGNFSVLVGHSTADYITFSDQDDIWDLEKIEFSLRELLLLEQTHGVSMPLVVVTDRRVADENGRKITDSFWENQGIHPRKIRSPFDYFFYPVAAGSSMLLNKSLLNLVRPIPKTAIMHDCWIELVAAHFGKAHYVEKTMLQYVKHSRNVSGGGRSYGASRYFRRANYLMRNISRQRSVYQRMMKQAQAFFERYGDQLGSAEHRKLKNLLAMEGAGISKVWLAPFAAGLPPTWERKLAFLLLI